MWPGQAAKVSVQHVQGRQSRGQPQAGGQGLGWARCQGSRVARGAIEEEAPVRGTWEETKGSHGGQGHLVVPGEGSLT